jgi:hypothetical protein
MQDLPFPNSFLHSEGNPFAGAFNFSFKTLIRGIEFITRIK